MRSVQGWGENAARGRTAKASMVVEQYPHGLDRRHVLGAQAGPAALGPDIRNGDLLAGQGRQRHAEADDGVPLPE